MSFTSSTLLSALSLFSGMLVCFETGRRIGSARLARDDDGLIQGSGPAVAAVFGLLGLLLAFTFSGAASRFDARRHLIAEEVNTIGTAYLRIDMLPEDVQSEMRQLFRRYLDLRIEAYRNTTDGSVTKTELSEEASMRGQIWSKAVAAVRRPEASAQAATLLLPALNAMINITTTRAMAIQNHPPRIIFLLLAVLSLASALLLGYVTCGTRVRNWFYMLLVAVTISLSSYVILDLEYPRSGLIRIDAADQHLIELRQTIR